MAYSPCVSAAQKLTQFGRKTNTSMLAMLAAFCTSGVRRCERGLGHQVGLEVGPVVVSVLRVDLHRLDVERGGRVNQLCHASE